MPTGVLVRIQSRALQRGFNPFFYSIFVPLFNMSHFQFIAGPCSAESEQQVLETALALKNTTSLAYFRAGIWKPRTNPNTFEGMGSVALPWMQRVKQELGLKIITEVATTDHVEQVLSAGFDAVWIGARTTVNPFSIQELAEALRGTNLPVFIKNPLNPDLSLWLGAFERFERLGITNLTAIHRGFSVANKKPYRNKPLWEIPIAFKTQRPHTPLICDPSHIAGDRQLIKEVSQRALDLGMSGLMVETHPTPDFALSDAKQQITPAAFAEMVSCLHFRSEDTSDIEIDTLNHLRERIDSIDMEILELMGKRMEISREIGQFKKQNEITIFQLERWKEIMQNRNVWGKEFQLTPTFMEAYLEILHKESIRQQNGVMNNDEEA